MWTVIEKTGSGEWTEAMPVPGGMVLRCTTFDGEDEKTVAMSMVFVPSSASTGPALKTWIAHNAEHRKP